MVLVSPNGSLRDSMLMETPAAALVQGLGDAIQVLHDQGVRADDISTTIAMGFKGPDG